MEGSGRFTAGKRTPGTHWTGERVGPRVGLDAVEKNLLPLPRIESRLSSRQTRNKVVIRSEFWCGGAINSKTLCLNKHHAMNTHVERNHSCTKCGPRHQMAMSNQLHVTAAIPPKHTLDWNGRVLDPAQEQWRREYSLAPTRTQNFYTWDRTPDSYVAQFMA
jgi:hypothetical protein